MRTPGANSFLQKELDTELLQKLFETANLTKHGASSLLHASYEEAINSGAIEFDSAEVNSAWIIAALIVVGIIIGTVVACICLWACCHGICAAMQGTTRCNPSLVQTGEVAWADEGDEYKRESLGGSRSSCFSLFTKVGW